MFMPEFFRNPLKIFCVVAPAEVVLLTILALTSAQASIRDAIDFISLAGVKNDSAGAKLLLKFNYQ